MGIVYRGIDETLMRTVAVKTLKNVKIEADKKEQFLAEARRLAKLSHPNVVQIYDVGKVSQRPYFVMEFLEGLTLASRLARGPMSQMELSESSGRCVTDCTRFIGLASCIVISSQAT